MLRLLSPAYLQLAVVLLFPGCMITSQMFSNAHALHQYAQNDGRTADPVSQSISRMPVDVVLSHSDRVWTGKS